jgi:ribosomal protein S18 acetylase RimI-like enzyme
VDKANYAVKMYQKLGFEIVEENEQDYLMVIKLKENRKDVKIEGKNTEIKI